MEKTSHGVAKRRALVVDDDDQTARAIADELAQHGFEVQFAHDGAIALEVVRGFQPDLLVVQVQLPVLDGAEVTRRLRERIGDVPVIDVGRPLDLDQLRQSLARR